jgi:sirohydrochlorin cobaltochelatase
MAHGTPHPSNAYYSVIQNRLDEANLGNVFIYSVEGWPHLDTVMPQLKAKGIKTVTLMPMMMVAGDHANNDMAGADADSHKSILEKEGFKVNTYIHGLGENPAVRKLFVERADEAWNALESGNTTSQKTHMMRH